MEAQLHCPGIIQGAAQISRLSRTAPNSQVMHGLSAALHQIDDNMTCLVYVRQASIDAVPGMPQLGCLWWLLHRQNILPESAICMHNLMTACSHGVTRRKHHRPGIAPNANTTHVPTAGSSAAPTKPNHTPSQHSRAKGKLLQAVMVPQAQPKLSLRQHPCQAAFRD